MGKFGTAQGILPSAFLGPIEVTQESFIYSPLFLSRSDAKSGRTLFSELLNIDLSLIDMVMDDPDRDELFFDEETYIRRHEQTRRYLQYSAKIHQDFKLPLRRVQVSGKTRNFLYLC
jgi:hypothetical protein